MFTPFDLVMLCLGINLKCNHRAKGFSSVVGALACHEDLGSIPSSAKKEKDVTDF